MNKNIGIDYSRGSANLDKETGIHYGVISQHAVMSEALDDLEMDYGEPTCPKCENGVSDDIPDELEDELRGYDFYCAGCKRGLDSAEVYSDEPIGFTYEQEGYILTDCLDSDILVLKSPYYTYTQFCSPCVPGAGNLDTPVEDGVKTYALGHDWFEDGKAPYPLYSVETDEEV